MKHSPTSFSVRHPFLIVLSVFVITIFFLIQFPKVHFDNDPENMLSKDEPVRVFHNEVKRIFNLYDFVIVGIVNEKNRDGVFNVGTLTRIYDLTKELLSLDRGNDGRPKVKIYRNGKEEKEISVNLYPESLFDRILLKIFHQDPNRLFDEDGRCAIVKHEIISPSLVDSLRQAELGSLKIEYLMERPPKTREEALRIKRDAMDNPLYRGTLVSEDGRAICLYIPIRSKRFSYNVANLVRFLTKDWPEEDKVYITGLPVAEDTFGVEMLIQMATSAPIAGITIFFLLLIFFKRLSLVVSPMILAVITVICTMGLLIGLGFDVHIMSSMIPIFLIPISVADSVHILSEFFDTYHLFGDKERTIKNIITHLFFPMLYTSLTTIVGFASLATTPIPPVKVFGLHVAFGVALAWILTITFIPAYIMIFARKRSLEERRDEEEGKIGILGRFLEWLGSFSISHKRGTLLITFFVLLVSIHGIFRIKVNDNPIKWFVKSHPIRIADRVLNSHFGGTYTAYLVVSPKEVLGFTCREKGKIIEEEAKKRFGAIYPEETKTFLRKLHEIEDLFRNIFTSDPKRCFVLLVKEAEKIDHSILDSWNNLADTINYLEPEGLDFNKLLKAIEEVKGVRKKDKNILLEKLSRYRHLTGEALIEKALDICDQFLKLSFKDFVFEMETELTAPVFKRPDVLRYIDRLQRYMKGNPIVGKTSSAVDALKKANYELKYVSPPSDATPEERKRLEQINLRNFSIPDTVSAVSQVFIQLEGMKKKDALFHFVTRDYMKANIWVQLKSGDNKDMEAVVKDVNSFIKKNPPPIPLEFKWAGLTYLNVIWQNKMVKGMFYSLMSSFLVVLIMMMLLFRSPLFGILSMIPLSITIVFIYGLIGIVGKDYDMPVAVLSSLTLGLSVDFAIHFLERSREIYKRVGNWRDTVFEMFKEPAVAITRNAITISIGFTPLLIAPLVPYKTVGFLIAAIMAVSWISTLLILPSLCAYLERYLFRREEEA